MTERDSDIEFDFFDEPETQEATQRRRPRRGRERGPRGPRPPRRPIGAPTGLTPLLRLVLLIAFAIFVVVLLVFWVQSCRGASKHNEYADYMNDVRAIAGGSAGVGKQLNDALTTPGIKLAALETRLNGLAQQESQYADQAQRVDPPGPLRNEHQHLVEVLQLRSSGIFRLSDAFRQTARKNASTSARLLAEQMQLLVASDVNWDFYFRSPASKELRSQGVTGVAVPDSNVLQNPELASVRSLIPVFQRVHGAATTGPRSGVHGVGLVSVAVSPGGQQLSESSETKITASIDLAFAVAVKNTGEGQEVRVPVTLTIQKTPAPIVKRGTIDVIDVGATKTITFRIREQPPFGTPTRVKVEAGPVPSERTTTNNTAEYPVVFSLS